MYVNYTKTSSYKGINKNSFSCANDLVLHGNFLTDLSFSNFKLLVVVIDDGQSWTSGTSEGDALGLGG